MPTTTTNYSFNKPLVNNAIDADLWGAQLNTNFDSLDSLLKVASDNVTRTVTTSPVSTSTSDRNKVILANATSAAITVNLLAAATAGDGFMVIVKKTDSSSNTVTIDGNSSETIDGATTYVISTQNDSVMLVCNGTSWAVAADVKTVAAVAAASQAEQEAGSITTAYTSPARQQFHPSAAKAWVKFNAAGTILASYNIASVTKNGTGDYTITYTTAFSSAEYGIAIGFCPSSSATGSIVLKMIYLDSANLPTTTTCRVLCRNFAGSNIVGTEDPTQVYMTFYGDQ